MPLVRASISQPPSRGVTLRKTENTFHTAEKRKMSTVNAPNMNQSNRSSAASYGSELKFQTRMKLTNSGDGKNVFFKQDGERFEHVETLKLSSAVNYTVQLEIDPVLELQLIRLAGIEYSFRLVNDPEMDIKSIYELTWCTNGIKPNLNRHRSDVPCTIKFKNYKELDFKLQVKFYEENESKRTTWGEILNAVLLECTAGRGTYASFVDSIKLV